MTNLAVIVDCYQLNVNNFPPRLVIHYIQRTGANIVETGSAAEIKRDISDEN